MPVFRWLTVRSSHTSVPFISSTQQCPSLRAREWRTYPVRGTGGKLLPPPHPFSLDSHSPRPNPLLFLCKPITQKDLRTMDQGYFTSIDGCCPDYGLNKMLLDL